MLCFISFIFHVTDRLVIFCCDFCAYSVPPEPDQWQQIYKMRLALTTFLATVPEYILDSTATGTVRVDPDLALVHTLIQVAIIQLYQPLIGKDHNAYEKCLNAAKKVTTIARNLIDGDYSLLDPILGVSSPPFSLFSLILLRSVNPYWIYVFRVIFRWFF